MTRPFAPQCIDLLRLKFRLVMTSFAGEQ